MKEARPKREVSYQAHVARAPSPAEVIPPRGERELCQSSLLYFLQELSGNFAAGTVPRVLGMPRDLLIESGIPRHLVFGVPFFVGLAHETNPSAQEFSMQRAVQSNR
jgi:hypothetical protein